MNTTTGLEQGIAFLLAKAKHFETEGLTVEIGYTKAKGRDFDGFYRWDDRHMSLAIKRRLRYPRQAAYGVGTVPSRSPRARRPFQVVWHEETFRSANDLLVFVAAHEVWHFLCHTGQRKSDFETKANCHGFEWLAEFQTWLGPSEPVAPIPRLPSRPDRPAPTAPPLQEPLKAPSPWAQLELF